MPDSRNPQRAVAANTAGAESPHQALRQLGARAHQLRAAVRAADHFNAGESADDRDTGSWLISTALMLSAELTGDVDGLARGLKEAKTAEPGLLKAVATVRERAHQTQAAARAADHFLEQPGHEDRDTGGWMVATLLTLAQKLAADLDDCAAPARRGFVEADVIDPNDPALARRVGGGAPPLRGAA